MTQTLRPFISSILLAAGLSTRMGQPKQLLPFDDSTIVETVVDNMLNAKFDEVIVVVGHQAARIREKLGLRPVKIVFNPDYRDGMLTSAQAGVRSIFKCNREASAPPALGEAPNPRAFALMLVDQPFITASLIDKVVEAYVQTEKGIALPSYNYRRGHPVIFHERYARDILALDTESGGVRTLFKRHADDIHYVSVDTDWVLRDIDYREDYERALRENA